MSEKLQKVLAGRGLGSRREIERWIAAGRIVVNDHVATLGERVGGADRIAVDGRPLAPPQPRRSRVLVANKRAGVIVTRKDPGGRPTVFDQLPPVAAGRWIAVGRLDIQTTGLLLLTNDGSLANKLAHPSTGIDREYAVRIKGRLNDAALAALQRGILVEGRQQSFSDIRYYAGRGDNHWYHVVLMEGRNREVRQLFASQGAAVTRLKRVRYGPVILPPWLPRGAWEEMGSRDLATLRSILGLRVRERRQRDASSGRSMLIPYPKLRSEPAAKTNSAEVILDGPGSPPRTKRKP